MTGIKLVDAICPELTSGSVVTTMNHERWFQVVGNKLHIPSEHVLHGNFILLDQCIEALHNFADGAPAQGWWDDTKVQGKVVSIQEAVDFLITQKVLACDIETCNLGFDDNKVLLIGFAYDDYNSIVVDVTQGDVTPLQKLFNSPDIKFIWHNGKFDTVKLAYLLHLSARVDEDTMLQHYACINERKGTHDLKSLGPLYLQAPQWDDELDNYKKKYCAQHKILLKQFQYDMLPRNILVPYLYRDCCATFQLHKKFSALARSGSENIYRQLVKASNVFRDIELAGCLVDDNYLFQLEDELDTLIVEAERHVRIEAARFWNPRQYGIDTGAKTCPTEFSHKSPKQLKWLLEKVIGRKLESTNKDTLEPLIEEFEGIPFIKAIGDLRKYNKYMDTYVQGIQKVKCVDGKVRCTFKLYGTETGRLSCADPNMQNIPRSKLVKNLFIAPEKYKLVQLDYSQAELRVLAYLSQDEHLRKVYRDGEDLHDAMALAIFGPDFTKEQRVAAKTINFGIPYGRGPGSMKAKLHMSIRQAINTIQEWFKAAPGAKTFVDAMRRSPYQSGEPYTTVFGRQRHYIITSENRNHVENEAVNFPISSIASDLTMMSVCEIHDKLIEEGIDARIVNTVHDSIIIECIDEPEALKRVVQIGTSTMSDMPKRFLINPVLDFPFIADAEIGRRWGDLEDADQVL